MTLEPRLAAIADFVRGPVHADIGSDHGLLATWLLKRGCVQKVIAVENHPGPFARSRVALKGLNAEVRFGDGLGPLAAGEVQSLSMSGVGSKTILRVLARHPNKLAPSLILQANDDPESLRAWGLKRGFHLQSEAMVAGFWRYAILRFERRSGPDPAYEGLALAPALRYGPHLLREKDPELRREIEQDAAYFKDLRRRQGAPVADKLALAEAGLEHFR